MDRLKSLEEKIAAAVEKVKTLKEEKTVLERSNRELQTLLDEKSQELETLKAEKTSIRGQVEELLNELETLEI